MLDKFVETTGGELERLRAENERLREALVALLDTAIILSDEYLDVFNGKSDKDTLYSFSMGQWRQLSVAARNAHAALETAVIDRANKADIQETEQYHSNDILGFG